MLQPMPAAVTHCESIETADSEDSSAIIQFCAKRCFHVRTERAWQQLQLCTIIAQAIIVLLMNLFSYKEKSAVAHGARRVVSDEVMVFSLMN